MCILIKIYKIISKKIDYKKINTILMKLKVDLILQI